MRPGPVLCLLLSVAACDGTDVYAPPEYALAYAPPAPPAPSPPSVAVAPPFASAPPSYGLAPATPARTPMTPGMSVLAYANAQVGHPYCWGGTGPGCFDCSGLTLRAWQQVGVQLPREADDIPRRLPSVPMAQMRPGDILWWPGHVAIYAGDGWSVEALNARSGVVRRRAPLPRGVYRPAGA